MTVQELIAVLAQMDPATPVAVYDGSWDCARDVTEVAVEDDQVVLY